MGVQELRPSGHGRESAPGMSCMRPSPELLPGAGRELLTMGRETKYTGRRLFASFLCFFLMAACLGIFRQMGKLCMIGVPVGLGIGAVISFVVVPLGVMGMSGGYMIKDSNAVSVSFSPVIYIGAAALSILTTLVGSLKPAGIAGSISPIEALHYQGMALKNKKVNKRKNDTEKGRAPHKNKLYRMAWRNVFRGKKSAVLTFLSLFLGLSIFLVTTGILSSIDVSVIAEQYFAENEDISVTLYDNSKPMITEEMMSDIQNMDGFGGRRLYK